jgi:hypothetical protein
MASSGDALAACGCCQGPGPVTPLEIHNRPALRAIGYRVGDYPTFREAMIEAIPRVGAKLAADRGLAASPLARWTSRRPDDLGIALLELWAVLGDVLTFYQERVANEAYLRTALHLDSIRRLAAMLDYRVHPGVAAETLLAFTLEPAATVQVPVGLRAQSVPAQGQVPQTFEAVEAVGARAELNQVRLFPEPKAANPLAPKGTSGILRADSMVPAAGDRLLLFPARGKPFLPPEEKVVETLAEADGRTVLTWSPPVQAAGWATDVPGPDGKKQADATARLAVVRRTFRLFGADAPRAYLKPSTATGNPPLVVWTFLDSATNPAAYSFKLPANDPKEPGELPLDAVYDDLTPATRLLIRTSTQTLETRVDKVLQCPEEQGPLAATVTVVILHDKLTEPENIDRAEVLVYELDDQDVELRSWAMDTKIRAGGSTVYADLAALPALEAGRLVVVDDASGQPQVVTVAADGVPARAPLEGAPEPPAFLALQLSSAIGRDLDSGSARLLGNLARATHGETVAGEVVGSGDGSLAFQAFTLAKRPVTRVRSAAAPGGAQSTLSLRVDQVQWQEVASLLGQPPVARVYTTELDDEGGTTVRFGDGVTGARPPTGRNNLTATYRHGLGRAGNLGPGRITTALDRPPGLAEVTNPVPSTGGTDPEDVALARVNAPNTVRVFDRAIALRDFADLARGFAGVEKALATSVWNGEVQTVHLTVAGPDGALLPQVDLDSLREYLDLRRDPNRALLVGNHQPVAVTITATVQVDPAHINPVVEAAARAALDGLLSFGAREFAQPVHLSDVYAALQAPDGVVSVDVDAFTYADPVVAKARGATSPVQARLRINPAIINPLPPPVVLGAELAVVATPSAISVTASGGLAS